jgi:hypothetical protein
MDEKDFYGKLENLEKRLSKYTDDKIVAFAKKYGIKKFIRKLVKYADEYNELRRSYKGDISSYYTDELAYSIRNRIGDIDRLIGELLQQSQPQPVPQKKTPPTIPKKSKEVKQKYEELMKKPIVLREGKKKKEKISDFETMQKKAVKGLKDWEQGLSSADRARIEARIAEVMAKAKAKKAPTKETPKAKEVPEVKKTPTKEVPKKDLKKLINNLFFKVGQAVKAKQKARAKLKASPKYKSKIEKRSRDIIIKAWGNLDENLADIISKQNPELYMKIVNLLLQEFQNTVQNSAYGPAILGLSDIGMLSFFKNYTDEIFEKYGAKALFGGIDIIVNELLRPLKFMETNDAQVKYESYYKLQNYSDINGILNEENTKKLKKEFKAMGKTPIKALPMGSTETPIRTKILSIEASPKKDDFETMQKKAVKGLKDWEQSLSSADRARIEARIAEVMAKAKAKKTPVKAPVKGPTKPLPKTPNKAPVEGPTKSLPKPPNKGPKSNREIIIEAWGEGDPLLSTILYQNDPKRYADLENWLSKTKKKFIDDVGMLSFFKDYNDEIFERYGADALFRGIDIIMEDMFNLIDNLENSTYKSYYKLKDYRQFLIKKGYLNRENRFKLGEIMGRPRPDK